MIGKCGACSKIYDSFDDYRNRDPFCSGAGIVNHYDEEEGCRDIVFYVPCKDDYYDSWFTINYCPQCGRSLK